MLAMLATGVCLGQTDGTAPPEQNSEATQQDSGTKELFVPATPKNDFGSEPGTNVESGEGSTRETFCFQG
jgi:hypothetical protein